MPLELAPLVEPALFDTGAWTWARDRRFPELTAWFNDAAAAGLILICDLVLLELTRLSPNQARAQEVVGRLEAFETVPMPSSIWRRSREIQIALSASGDHRRVPPTDLLIATAAEEAGIQLIHYDRDYERIASVGDLDQRWMAPDGALA